MSDQWYYSQNQQQTGPVSLDRLRQLVAEGRIGPAELVWSPQLPAWTPADRVPELAVTAVASATPAAMDAEPLPLAPLAYSGADADRPVQLTPRSLDLLRRTQGWTRLIAILIFVGAAAILVGPLLAIASDGVSSGSLIGLIVLGVVAYFAIAPGRYLWRYSAKIGQLLTAPREDRLEEALDAQRAFWRYAGLLILVSLAAPFVIALLVRLAMMR